jgi:2-polyprenyl-3-methyl-5-hydroxy-6-metoxy-1,4-benzoquinol methylase
MNTERDPVLSEVNVHDAMTLVSKKNGVFHPLFSSCDVNRDNFIQLRKELISLGCHQQHVIKTARDLCMQVMNIKSIQAYNEYILNQTYTLCSAEIKTERDEDKIPIQDLTNEKYSHINLFSAIYKFEINFLKKAAAENNICDIGCGDGLFLRLLSDAKMQATGYEIEVKDVTHPVPIKKITDVSDITECYEFITLNHVLEHIEEHPCDFLDRLIRHMNSLGKKIKAIIISLPIHLSLQAHLASGHFWVCYPTDLPPDVMRNIENSGLRFFQPERELKQIAKQHGYKVSVHPKIGTYVIE